MISLRRLLIGWLAVLPLGVNALTVERIEKMPVASSTIRDWSGDRLVADRFEKIGNKQISQVITFQKDGSNLINWTYPPSTGGPPADCHKGFAHFHPSGKYLIMTVESQGGGRRCGSPESTPGKAAWTDLWLLNLESREWTNLTRYTGFPHKPFGALSPYFSHDGKAVVWSKPIEWPSRPPRPDRVFGKWEMHVAELSLTPTPHLTNDKVLFKDFLFEPHGFSPDGSRILFSSDMFLSFSGGLELFELNLKTLKVQNLTRTPIEYDEHARYSSDGRWIAWGSGKWVANDPAVWYSPFLSEVTVMQADGTESVQLTRSNTLGTIESCDACGSWPAVWSPDSRQIIFNQQIFPLNPAANVSWLITFKKE